jgi:nitrate/nitrite transporter NarK
MVHSSIVPVLKGLFTTHLLYFHIFGLLLGINLLMATKYYQKQYIIDMCKNELCTIMCVYVCFDC